MAENKRESVGNLNVKVDVDVSEAIKGLKAVQREVKETVRSLAELRSQGEAASEYGGKYDEYIKRIEDVVGQRTGERAMTNDIIYRAYETKYAGPLLFRRCAGVTTSLRALAETFDDVVYLDGFDEKPSENELNGKIVFKEPGVRLPGFASPLRLITIETVDEDKGSLIVIDCVARTSAKVFA
ncbi:hypothetical protein CTV96_09705 [Bacillus altitudinis]|uniref:hypothetical protein n=1 Tax=Bacillus altitudinis TaxID=293387 RepID=UPI000C244438|nr:hypothetical protein [Bacillus altitudinis]PJI12411.1 hypothetical protein CTV96_09705 [Bacillus altitudinis]PKQ85574.1 hypothetical protein CTV98_007390 [Bacillus altitudinis]